MHADGESPRCAVSWVCTVASVESARDRHAKDFDRADCLTSTGAVHTIENIHPSRATDDFPREKSTDATTTIRRARM